MSDHPRHHSINADALSRWDEFYTEHPAQLGGETPDQVQIRWLWEELAQMTTAYRWAKQLAEPPAMPKAMECQCGESVPMSEGHTYEQRHRFVVTHSDSAYYGMDWDPAPVHTRIGSQIKVDGQVVHDCATSAAFLD